MANGWLNQWGTNLGNMLLQQQNPYADSSKMTPEQWRSGVSGGLLSLAGGIGQFGNQAPLGALGSAFNQLGQQGQERGLNLMRARVLQSEVSEKERDARLREQLTRQLFPDMAGVEAAPAGAPATQAPQMPVGAPMAPPVSGATAQANRAPAAMPSGQPEAAAPQDLDAAFIEQFGPEHFQKVKAMSPATPIKEIYQRLYPEDPGAAVNATLRNPTLRNMTLGQWIGDVERRSGQGALPATATTQSAPDNTARLQQLRKALFIAPASMREGIKAEIDALTQQPRTRTVTTSEGVFDYDPVTGVKKFLGKPTEKEGKEFSQAKDLRNEFVKANKNFTDVREHFQRVQAAASNPNPTGADDIALVYGYMKMLDPASVVREGEFATAQNAVGVPEQVRAMFNRLITGERLPPSARADMIFQASAQFENTYAQYEASRQTYSDLATRMGVDPAQVTIDLTAGVKRPERTPQARKSSQPEKKFKDAASVPEGRTVTDDATGQKLIKRGGQLVPVP